MKTVSLKLELAGKFHIITSPSVDTFIPLITAVPKSGGRLPPAVFAVVICKLLLAIKVAQ
jgi:hypothetical protein